MSSEIDVQLQDVSKTYGHSTALDQINLEVRRGELVALLGPSGSGKTTTLRIVAGLIEPTAGLVYIRGRLMNGVPVHRRDLGMVFQHYGLFPHMTVFDNVAFGLKMRKTPRAEIERRVTEALALVHLSGMEARYPHQLSGGQQQRVALARCIVFEPSVLLLDEPFGALDKKLRASMQVEVRALQQQLGITTLLVTHDQEEALTMADSIAVMNQGRIEQIGTPMEVYERPTTRFVSDFIGVCNFLHGEVIERDGAEWVVVTDRGLRLRVASADARSLRQQVTVAIRPEKIQMDAPTINGAVNRTSARIQQVIYLGTSTHHYLLTADGHELIVFTQNLSPSGSPPVCPGQTVSLSWAPEVGQVLTE